MCILVIEDDASINDILEELLELEGYCIYSAKTAEEGINLAVNKNPKLILCDILLYGSNIDGYGIYSVLKKNPKTNSIPFAFLTAMASKNDREKIENLSIPYIFKPFNIDNLLNFIKTILNKS